MVAALNAAGLDMATLGNHEFDFGPDVLLQRMPRPSGNGSSRTSSTPDTGQPIGGAPPVRRADLRLAEGGVHRPVPHQRRDRAGPHGRSSASSIRWKPPRRTCRCSSAKASNVIVAVTHLTFAEDRALAERFPEIDVIIGGHEHYPITATENRTLISKAGSDAKFVARIDVNRRAERHESSASSS